MIFIFIFLLCVFWVKTGKKAGLWSFASSICTPFSNLKLPAKIAEWVRVLLLRMDIWLKAQEQMKTDKAQVAALDLLT